MRGRLGRRHAGDDDLVGVVAAAGNLGAQGVGRRVGGGRLFRVAGQVEISAFGDDHVGFAVVVNSAKDMIAVLDDRRGGACDRVDGRCVDGQSVGACDGVVDVVDNGRRVNGQRGGRSLCRVDRRRWFGRRVNHGRIGGIIGGCFVDVGRIVSSVGVSAAVVVIFDIFEIGGAVDKLISDRGADISMIIDSLKVNAKVDDQ